MGWDFRLPIFGGGTEQQGTGSGKHAWAGGGREDGGSLQTWEERQDSPENSDETTARVPFRTTAAFFGTFVPEAEPYPRLATFAGSQMYRFCRGRVARSLLRSCPGVSCYCEAEKNS